jgi:hypothetical protein
MDGRKDTLNDAALEHEIEALLSVEPSPGFVSRVRSRVAEEPTSSGWGWRWPIAAVATAMAVAAVGVALWRPVDQPAPSTSAPLQQAAAADVPAPVVTVPRDEPVVVRAQRRYERVVSAPSRTIELALPPVMIAENETRAFAVLVRTAPTTRFDFVSPAAPSGAPLEVEKMPKMDLVTVAPIVIKPLVSDMTAE